MSPSAWYGIFTRHVGGTVQPDGQTLAPSPKVQFGAIPSAHSKLEKGTTQQLSVLMTPPDYRSETILHGIASHDP
jgi:hypothetical protein